MKKFDFIISLVLAAMFFEKDVYTIHFRTIDDEERWMEEFRGKKIKLAHELPNGEEHPYTTISPTK